MHGRESSLHYLGEKSARSLICSVFTLRETYLANFITPSKELEALTLLEFCGFLLKGKTSSESLSNFISEGSKISLAQFDGGCYSLNAE